MSNLKEITLKLLEEEKLLKKGGGKKGVERQHRLGRLTARERISRLIDPKTHFIELGLWAAYDMYSEWGETPAAGIITESVEYPRKTV